MEAQYYPHIFLIASCQNQCKPQFVCIAQTITDIVHSSDGLLTHPPHFNLDSPVLEFSVVLQDT